VDVLGRDLAKSSAEELREQVHTKLVDAGSGDLAQELELVETDGAFGLAVLPKRRRVGMEDLLPKHAVYVFARTDGKVRPYVSLMERLSPWFGPLIPTLPSVVSAVIVIREVMPTEAGRLRVSTEQNRGEVLKAMTTDGIVPNMQRVSVLFDVGFAGQRAESGIGREGTLGLWRSSIRGFLRISPEMIDKIEQVLFGGKRRILTSSTGSRKLGASEAKLIADDALI
jgi:hypothetical protein